MQRIPSVARTALAVVALSGTLAATSHTSVWSPARRGTADPVTLLTIVAVAFGVCCTTAAAYSAFRRMSAARALATTGPPAVVAAVLLSLFLVSKADLRYGAAATREERIDSPTREGVRLESDWRGPAHRNGGREDEVGALAASSDFAEVLRRLVAIVAIAGLAAVLLARQGARRSARGQNDKPFGRVEREAAHASIMHSIEAMLGDPDPRTAIIGAYARLLEELANNGAPRHTYEGPEEHLRRILGLLDARPGALKTLVRLFEIARFSDHSLTDAHRSEALHALQEVADDLAAHAAGPTSDACA